LTAKNSSQKFFKQEMAMQIMPRSLSERLLEEYEASLAAKASGTVDAYLRAVRQLLDWVAARPGNAGNFHPDRGLSL
jgi:hypothetical protein